MKGLFTILFALVALVTAATNDTNSTSELSGGAIAGIVIGSLAGVAAIGALVWYLFFMNGAMYAGASGPAGAVTTGGQAGGSNHIPMVALRVARDDDEL